MNTLLLVLCVLMLIVIALIVIFRPKPNNNLFALSYKLDELFGKLDKITINLKEDFRTNREEIATASKENRTELSDTLLKFKTEMNETLRLITEQNRAGSEGIHKTLDERITALINKVEENNKAAREAITANLKDFSLDQRAKLEELKIEQKESAVKAVEQLEKITAKVEEKLTAVNEQAKSDSHLMRQTLDSSFKGFSNTFTQSVETMNNLQREKFTQLEDNQMKLVDSTEKKLEQMRETVDEKLQKTLNERLGQSFELVGKQLESVQKGLGEMQSLAQDVGGLKRVLSNVKMRGGFGEVQLEMLLENILAPDQYEANVKLKEHSTELVEFAIKMPNRDEDRNYVWLAIDAKFPRDAYEYLQNAYDTCDVVQIEEAQKNLELTIRKMAKDICEKYINPPNTTDFAIMFLPFEGIYAEVVRKASLLEEIQKQCKVVITGPTTLAAILNSLQMGFRTLAIQKRSSEVWSILGAVKKEFESFGGMLEKAQKNIQTASNQLDEVMGKRTRAIQRKLKSVEVLDDVESQVVLSDLTTKELLEDEEN
ncbi:MAG TPA: DNA recombination protein RmuC [Chitinophagaceae bacterium]|nr:DNA recombination protein RmuC [Chitinophagaceae bacterium]